MSTQFSHEAYQRLVKDTFDTVMRLSTLKGGEYSGDDDRLLNFRRNGAALGLPKETIWGVYAAKHWDALMQYIKDLNTGKDRQRLESLEGRCDDLIVYLLLFKAMLVEAQPAPNVIGTEPGKTYDGRLPTQTEIEVADLRWLENREFRSPPPTGAGNLTALQIRKADGDRY